MKFQVKLEKTAAEAQALLKQLEGDKYSLHTQMLEWSNSTDTLITVKKDHMFLEKV